MPNAQPYGILVGPGKLYVAAVGTAFPDVDADPGVEWTDLGDTDGGVTVTLEQTIDQHRTDQSTGPKKATRSEENLYIETNLAEATLENLAYALTESVVDTPPGTGQIGTRELQLYRGKAVNEYAFLFRAYSPYGNYPGQYQLPRGYFDGEIGLAYVKDTKVLIPVRFVALEDPNAATEAERFGSVIVQDAEATG